MRTETGPFARPTACVVTNREDGELINFQVIIDRPEPTPVVMKREIVEQAAREECGMLPASEVIELRESMDRLSTELDDLTDTMNLAAELEQRVMPERVAA